MDAASFSLLDAGFGIIMAVFVLRGLLCGFVQELAGLVGLVGGILAASRFYHLLVPHVSKVVSTETWAIGISYVIVFFVVGLLVVLAGKLIKKMMKETPAAWTDYLLGGLFGALKGALVCTVVYLVLVEVMPKSEMLANSFFAPYLAAFANILKPYLPSIS